MSTCMREFGIEVIPATLSWVAGGLARITSIQIGTQRN